MLFKKTAASKRGNYLYKFNDGTVSVIAGAKDTEVLIKLLHAFDDAEVYNNITNSSAKFEPWQKKFAEEWKEQYPGGKSDPLKEFLYEKLAELSEEGQEMYRLYFIEGYSQEKIAEMKGVSQNTISKKIRKKLTEMCRKEI